MVCFHGARAVARCCVGLTTSARGCWCRGEGLRTACALALQQRVCVTLKAAHVCGRVRAPRAAQLSGRAGTSACGPRRDAVAGAGVNGGWEDAGLWVSREALGDAAWEACVLRVA